MAIAQNSTSNINQHSAASKHSAAHGNQVPQKKKIDIASNFEDMLQLAMAGIQYQDPLNPKDASELGKDTLVMAQAQALVEIRETFEKQNTLHIDNQVLNLASNIGKKAEIESDHFVYAKGDNQDIHYTLPTNVFKAKIQISDAQGNIVHSHIEKSSYNQAFSAKQYVYAFNGKPNTSAGESKAVNGVLPDNTYYVSVMAYDENNNRLLDAGTKEPVKISTSITGTITGATKNEERAYVQLQSEKYPLSSLLSVQNIAVAEDTK